VVGLGGALGGIGVAVRAAEIPAALGSGKPLVLVQSYGANWVNASNGTVPAGAFISGQDSPPAREPLYACRAAYANGIQLGKVSPKIGACDISYGGREIRIPQYQVLVGGPFGWAPVSNGGIPPRAVQGGNDSPPESAPLFVCQANYNGGFHPGKTRAGWNVCHIGWGGQAVRISSYAVLIQ
jgi:hypothetical protein